jgi:short-subunit dehydrogenase
MKVILLGGTSDIGKNLIELFLLKDYEVYATYRKDEYKSTLSKDVNWLKQDIEFYDSKIYKQWLEKIKNWDLFISCIGTQEPIGLINNIDSLKWVEGVHINSTYQIKALIDALPYREVNKECSVIFFAGGGTNSATPHYSAQTLGKILLIKFVELIASEIESLKVFILGPGWVKTKIHNATLNAPEEAGKNYEKTLEMLNSENLNPISKVLDDINQLLKMPKYLVTGRNFSSVHDDLSIHNLEKLYKKDKDFYKLRRFFNDE